MKLNRFHLIAAACLLSLCAVSANAEADVSAGYQKKIVELMEVIGAKNITRQVALTFGKQLAYSLKQAQPDLDSKAFAIIAEETDAVLQARSAELLKDMVPIYAKHFSEQDVDGLLAFYRSPVGRKTVAEMPGLMQESMELAVEKSKSSVPEIQSRVMQKLKADGLIKVPPAAAKP